MSVVLTMGAFDMFHAGHMSLLLACKKIAGEHGKVIVGVNSDEFMEDYKRKPIIPYYERSYIIRSLDFVTNQFQVKEHDAEKLLESWKPDFLVIGEDWAHKDYFTQIGVTREDLKNLGITLLYKSQDYKRTTTKTIQGMQND